MSVSVCNQIYALRNPGHKIETHYKTYLKMISAEIKCRRKSNLCDIFGSCTSIPKYNFKTKHSSEVTVDMHTAPFIHTDIHNHKIHRPICLETRINCSNRYFICNSNNNYYNIYCVLYILKLI